LEVGEFIKKVPGSTKDMQDKFRIAYKGIVVEKKPSHMRKEKPALNIKDL